MNACSPFVALGSEGRNAPPINAIAQRQPVRLQRTRRKASVTPPGAVYVGRPTIWGNPFSERPKIGHARSVIFYRTWIDGDLSPRTKDIRVMRDDGSHFDLAPAEAMRLSKALLDAIDVPTLVASLVAESEPRICGDFQVQIAHRPALED